MKDTTIKDIKPDYEAIFGGLAWDLDKAKYLLDDVQGFFETPDPEYPTRDNLEGIKYEYKHIVVILGLLSDVIEKMKDIVTPIS